MLPQLAAPGAASADHRPNIVVVMTDDQAYRDMIAMPKTRRLIGTRGATLTEFVVSFSLCCPSRATFLTGQYNHNNGVQGNDVEDGGAWQSLRGKTDTLPVWLDRAGYRTYHVGKFLNHYAAGNPLYVPPGWDRWSGAPESSAYRMWNFNLNHDGVLVNYGNATGDYQTDVYRRLAVDFIRTRATKHQPFFLNVAPLAPHDESETVFPSDLMAPRPAPRDRGAFDGVRYPFGPNWNERDVSDKPRYVARQGRWGDGKRRWATRSHQMRLESLLAVDDLVEAIVAALRGTGQLDRTYLIFTSDNGFLLGEHRLKGKNLHYEESSRVPLLVRGPGIGRRTVIRDVAGNVDLARTIADMAGARPGRRQDGISLLRALHGRRQLPSSRAIVMESLDPYVGDGDTGIHRGLRTRRYVYIRYRTGQRELYDLRRDPDQLENRIGDPDYAAVERYLRRKLERLRDCRGRGCRAKVAPDGAPPA